MNPVATDTLIEPCHAEESITLLLCYQPAITCSKLTIETIEQGVEHVQS